MVDHARTGLTPRVVEMLIRDNLNAMEQYYPALMALLHGDRSVREILDPFERAGTVDAPEESSR